MCARAEVCVCVSTASARAPRLRRSSSPVLTAPTLQQATRLSCTLRPPVWRTRGSMRLRRWAGSSQRPCRPPLLACRDDGATAAMLARLPWHSPYCCCCRRRRHRHDPPPTSTSSTAGQARPPPPDPFPPALPQDLPQQADNGTKVGDLAEEQQQAVRHAQQGQLRGNQRRLGAGSQAMTPEQMAMLRCIHDAVVETPAVWHRRGSGTAVMFDAVRAQMVQHPDWALLAGQNSSLVREASLQVDGQLYNSLKSYRTELGIHCVPLALLGTLGHAGAPWCGLCLPFQPPRRRPTCSRWAASAREPTPLSQVPNVFQTAFLLPRPHGEDSICLRLL